jgi:hypothetical protein
MTMRFANKWCVGIAAAALWLSPVVASAEGFVSPWVGPDFGNDQGINDQASFGFDVGGMTAGIIGGEFDFGYMPDFFNQELDDYALTAMANLLVGIPVGGTEGPGVRPYLTAGAGLIHTRLDLPTTDQTNNDLGINLGGGLMGFVSDHFGLRGDVRYFRNVTSDFSDSDLNPEFGLGDVDFWRASFGIVIR